MLLTKLLVFLLAGVNFSLGWRNFMHGRMKGGNLGTPILSGNYVAFEDQWFTQFLDHSNPTDARTWKQVRYRFLIVRCSIEKKLIYLQNKVRN